MSGLIKRRRKEPGERGVALLMVLVLVTLVAAVVTEFQYSSRVDLQLAYNARDELQAEYKCIERHARAGADFATFPKAEPSREYAHGKYRRRWVSGGGAGQSTDGTDFGDVTS